MSSSRRRWAAREQDPTRFTAVLARLCESTSALGAALVDRQGETVDYAGHVPTYDLKLAAAEWRLVLDRLSQMTSKLRLPHVTQLIVRATRFSFMAVPLSAGYALIIELGPRSGGVSARALAEAVRELCEEAALELPNGAQPERWELVEVRTCPDDERRPQALWRDGRWLRVEVLGRYLERELGHREIGFRVRLDGSTDISLVREPLGRWYAFDLPDG